MRRASCLTLEALSSGLDERGIAYSHTFINCFRYDKSEIIRSLYLLGFQMTPRIGFSVCPPRGQRVHTAKAAPPLASAAGPAQHRRPYPLERARQLPNKLRPAHLKKAPPPLLRQVGSRADVAAAHGVLFNGPSKAPARDS